MYCQNKIISLIILICCCKLINISNAKPQHNRHSISSSITTKTSHKDSKHSKHTSSNNNGIINENISLIYLLLLLHVLNCGISSFICCTMEKKNFNSQVQNDIKKWIYLAEEERRLTCNT